MRIGIFASRILPKLGGAELVVDNLARRFAAAGHQVTVIAPWPSWFARPSDHGLPYKVFRYPPHLSKHRFLAPYRYYLRQAYRQHRFEILHCHDVLPQAYLAVTSRADVPVPVVLTSHGSDVMATHSRYRNPKVLAMATHAMEEVEAMIAVSDTMRENFLQLCPEKTRVVDIPNGVDLKSFQRSSPRPPSLDRDIIAGQYALYLGRLTARKGVDTLLAALARLPRRGGVELVIAGYGRERKALEEQAMRLRLDDRVRFVGAVNGPAKRYLLEQARVTIVPTRTWEACSLVALESFAAGTPVIGSNIQGVRHLIRPEDNGLLFPPNSSEELAAALGRVWTDPAALARWRQGAKECIGRFDWDNIAQEHLALYEEIIAETSERYAPLQIHNDPVEVVEPRDALPETPLSERIARMRRA